MGAGVMHALLCRAAQVPDACLASGEAWTGGGGEWLGHLLTHLCLPAAPDGNADDRHFPQELGNGLLPELFASLASVEPQASVLERWQQLVVGLCESLTSR